MRFNPRAREGRDKDSPDVLPKAKAFQSTRPRGARLTRANLASEDGQVSIHAPARGATSRVLLQPLT